MQGWPCGNGKRCTIRPTSVREPDVRRQVGGAEPKEHGRGARPGPMRRGSGSPDHGDRLAG
eukprot:13183145-Alexandrium_andersonii.AAC.1